MLENLETEELEYVTIGKIFGRTKEGIWQRG